VDPFGPEGESIMDYNAFDAARAGFTRIIYVVRPEIEETIRRHERGILGDGFPVSFVLQTTEDVPDGFRAPPERRRPWGTAQALLCARNELDSPFGVCNADDLYGPDAFRQLREHLTADPQETEAALVGYRLDETLSGEGRVSRGICVLRREGLLERVTEVKKIRHVDGWISGSDVAGGKVELQGDEVASMNLWGFTPPVLAALGRQFRRFLDRWGGDPEVEFFLSTAINSQVQIGNTRVAVLQAEDQWFGVTHAGDREQAQARLNRRVDDGRYPESLRDAFTRLVGA
jgi:hypothetical protein